MQFPSYKPENKFMTEDMSQSDRMAADIVWQEIKKTSSFSWQLAFLSMNTWVKLLIRMSMTQNFGPLIKVLLNMLGDLAIFYILWSIILLTFTSIGCLVFADLEEYQEFFFTLYMHFEFSLGGFSDKVFCEDPFGA